MTTKVDKVSQRLQEIQKFVAGRINQDKNYSSIAQELEKLADSVKTTKPTVKIIGRFPIQAPALQNCLSSSKKLSDLCQFQTFTLPSTSQPTAPTSPAALILQYATVPGQKPPRHVLPTNQKVLIGRRSGCQLLIPDHYVKVSGHHAEVMPASLSSSGQTASSWQICDLNSTNGTYVNGNRLQGACQILQSGDQITLAYPTASEKCPEFIFESQAQVSSKDDEVDKLIRDCEVLCLVTNPSQPLSTEEKQLIEKASKTQSVQLFIVMDVPASGTPVDEIQKMNQAGLETWIRSQSLGKPVELVTLTLRPFYPTNSQGAGAVSGSQPQLNQFCKSLENLAQNWLDSKFVEQMNTKIIAQLSRIEQVLASQEDTLKKEGQKEEENLPKLAKALKKANKEKDSFFEQVKEELSNSKAKLLDAKRPKSINYKIMQLIDSLNLKISAIKEGNEVKIQLQSASLTSSAGGLNDKIVRFCYSELNQWATEEWQRICTEYVDGGLNELLQTNHSTLNVIPTLNVSKSLFKLPQRVDFNKGLHDSYLEFSSDVSFNQRSTGGNIINTVGKSAFLFLGGRYDIIAMNFLSLLGKGAARKQEEEAQIRAAEAELIKDLVDYYQSIAKDIVDRLMQNINRAIKGEKQRLEETFETVEEEFRDYAAEVKSRIDKQKNRQREMERDRAELERLQRFLV